MIIYIHFNKDAEQILINKKNVIYCKIKKIKKEKRKKNFLRAGFEPAT